MYDRYLVKSFSATYKYSDNASSMNNPILGNDINDTYEVDSDINDTTDAEHLAY